MNRSWKAKFFTIAIGQMFSLIGSSAVQFALIWWIASETNSALMMGLSGIVAFLPTALLSPAAGIVADRYNRKYICIIADLFIGLAAAVFAVLLWTMDLPVWFALLILFVRSLGNTFHQPALQAMVPQFVPREELTRANGWNQLLSSGSLLLGPAIGAALYAALPMPALLFTDLVGALIASAMLAVVKVPAAPRCQTEKRRIRREIIEGMQVFREDASLLLMTVMETLAMLFILPMASFYPLMTSGYFKGSAWHGSAVEVIYALGMMVTAFIFGSVGKVKRPLWLSYLGMLGMGAAAMLCGMLPPTMGAWVVFALAIGFIGACCNIHNVPLTSYMQSTIRPDRQGRAFAFMALLSSLSTPIGLAIIAPSADKIGVHRWFLLAGAGVCLLTLLGMFLEYRIERKQKMNGEEA